MPPMQATARPDRAAAMRAARCAPTAGRPRAPAARQHAAGGRADQDRERRPQRERGPRRQPGGACSDAHCLGQPHQAQEAHRNQQRHPQPLGHPHGYVQQVRDQVERAHREGVADVLVLEAAQVLQGVPQVPQPLVEAHRVDVHAELRVERHPARVLDKQHDQHDDPGQRRPAQAGPLGRVPPAEPRQPSRPPSAVGRVRLTGVGFLEFKRGGHARRRRISSRFHVSSSRRPGRKMRNRHQRG